MKRMPETPVAGLPPFTLEQLHSLAGLARWGKQAAVTAALGKSQSQISRDLTGLEQALGGVVLFDRATRKATARGEAVLAYARILLDGWERLQCQLSLEQGAAGTATLVAVVGSKAFTVASPCLITTW